MKEKKSFISVQEMVEIALFVALAVVLDFDGLKISVGGNGGSIGFTMVPLFILAYRHGFFKSIIGVGIIYAGITSIFDGWGIIYFPFDYFIAYGISISIASLFSKFIYYKNNKFINLFSLILSILVTGFIRIIGHSLSSIIIYEYTLGAAFSYNIAYVGPSILICIVVLLILYPTILLLNKRFPTNYTKKFK